MAVYGADGSTKIVAFNERPPCSHWLFADMLAIMYALCSVFVTHLREHLKTKYIGTGESRRSVQPFKGSMCRVCASKFMHCRLETV